MVALDRWNLPCAAAFSSEYLGGNLFGIAHANEKAVKLYLEMALV